MAARNPTTTPATIDPAAGTTDTTPTTGRPPSPLRPLARALLQLSDSIDRRERERAARDGDQPRTVAELLDDRDIDASNRPPVVVTHHPDGRVTASLTFPPPADPAPAKPQRRGTQ